MDLLGKHEIYIPADAEVKSIPLQSLPKSVLTRMGLPLSDSDASKKLTDSPNGIWISPAVLRAKGQKPASSTGSTLLENTSSTIAREFRESPGPFKMSFVSSNRAAHKVLYDTLNGENVSADTSSTPPLPLGSAPQNYQVAVVIYQGRIYLSIRKPRRSQQQREACDAPPASKSATPSASDTSVNSLKKRAAPKAPPKPAGKQPQRKKLRIPLPPGSLKLSLTKKNSTPNQKPLIGNRPERTPTQSKETQSEKKKDVTHNRREGSSSQAAPFVPASADGAHKVDDQSQSHVTAEQTPEEAAGWVQEETNTSSERQSTGEGEAAGTSNIHSNVQTDSRDHGSAGQSWTSISQQGYDYEELEQNERIALIRDRLRMQEAALKNMPT